MQVEEPKENYTTGWIKIYRSVNRHWLWKKPLSQFEAWLDILLEANHSQEKVNFGNDIYICERGEKMYSLDTWGNRWGWNKSRVRRFLNLLEKDSMVELKSNRYTTHLKIINYSTYQDTRNGNETEVKQKRNGSETEVTPIKELKNDKESKNTHIPELPEFLEYAKTLSIYKSSYDFQIEAKYNAWKEAGWVDGNNKKIKNWKTKLQNTMPYFKSNGVNNEKSKGSIQSRLDYKFDPDKSAKRLEKLKQLFGEGD